MPETIQVNERTFEIIRLLGHGKGGYSYLVKDSDQQFVVKQIHHEPCDYYIFGNKIEAELNDYERLRRAGIRIPELLDADRKNERILKQYIEGKTISEMIEADERAEPYLDQVREMAGLAKAAGLNIDYYPTNFVVNGGLLYYIDFECNEYMERWSFGNWGIKYWTGTNELKENSGKKEGINNERFKAD